MNPDKKNEKTSAPAPVLRHPLAKVKWLSENQVMIDQQRYVLLVNHHEAFDIEQMKAKYDPYLDQYDYIVGDVSSTHLRLKGFLKARPHVAIDKKADAIADYLMEYVNPGSAYFVLKRLTIKVRKRDRLHRPHAKRNERFKNKKNDVAKSESSAAKHEEIVHHNNRHFIIRRRGEEK